ncbi:PorV/PorQ family protein [bacterium]|nr:PorV/PorQ family protein [bacterium]
MATMCLRNFLASALVLVTSTFAVAQTTDEAQSVSNVGTNSAAFLEIGLGARAQAMGAAFTSLADDATAMYWNPSGIARLGHFEASFTNIDWLADTYIGYAAVVASIGDFGAVGVDASVLDAGERPVRTIAQPEGTGEIFSSSDLSLGLAFAMNLTDRFSIGFHAKYIRQEIWHESANGFALDLGALYDMPVDGMRLGFAILNFGTRMKLSGRDLQRPFDPDPLNFGNDAINVDLETQSFELPLMFRFGVSYRLQTTESSGLLISTDLLHPGNNTESINIGGEYSYNDFVFVRGGYESLFERDQENGLTLGGGLQFKLFGTGTVRIDYAYVDWGVLDNADRFTIALVF